MKKTLVIMAAGMGSRFGGLKQIEPVGPNGEFVIDYSVYDAKRAGFEKVIFVIKKELEETFKETIGKRVESHIEVAYAFQELEDILCKQELIQQRNKPWGTVQAVLCAKDLVEGDFVVINADDFYGYDSYEKASKFLDESTNDLEQACISYPYVATASKFGSVKRGVCSIEEGYIVRMIESKITLYESYGLAEPLNGDPSFKIALDTPVSMNMFAFKHCFFDYLEEYFNHYFEQSDKEILEGEALLPDLVREKLLTGEIVLKNIVASGLWLGITYKEDLDYLKEKVNDFIQKGDYPVHLWENE